VLPRAFYMCFQRRFVPAYYTTLEIALFRRLEYIFRLLKHMPTFERGDLFQKPGPETTMQYLWSRLHKRDLSQEEALALLSAVHHELGITEARDRKAYSSYTRFMESLSKDMPVIHDFVVSRWIENRHAAGRRQSRGTDEAAAQDEEEESHPDPSPIGTLRALESAPRAAAFETGTSDGPEEPGEPDDDSQLQEHPKAIERAAEEDPEDDGAAVEDTEEAGRDEVEEVDEDPGQATAEEEDSGYEDREFGEAQDSSKDAEVDEKDEQIEAGDEANAVDSGEPEGGESAGGDAGTAVESTGQEQGEWPALEGPEQAEPLEGLEAEGGEPAPMD